jgi:hypothetical protein
MYLKVIESVEVCAIDSSVKKENNIEDASASRNDQFIHIHFSSRIMVNSSAMTGIYIRLVTRITVV